MAIQARITQVTTTQTVTDGSGQTITVDLSLSGQMLVVAEYADHLTPTTVIHRQAFQVPSTEDEAAILSRVIAAGARIRDARNRTAQLQTRVGTTVLIP